jgi:hypothetical protein
MTPYPGYVPHDIPDDSVDHRRPISNFRLQNREPVTQLRFTRSHTAPWQAGHAQARHLHLLENRAGMRNKSATGLGKADATPKAVKELRAEIFLEFQDLL